MLAWIQDYLTDRSQNAILDRISSRNLPVSSGVPQGTVLAPLLFLCFVNDVPEFVQCKIRLYADDILLYSEINSLDDCLRLQADIDNLFSWSERWQLHFNPAKCEFLRITNKCNTISHSYTLENSSIKEVHSAKILYLGTQSSPGQITSHLLWIKQI